MAARRTVRLRKEYLYKKSLEGRELQAYERKEKLKAALQEGKMLPVELREDAAAIKDEADLDDVRTAQVRTHIDDEYASAGMRDPKVCITTSRDPSSRLKQFALEVKLLFPGSQRVNRGNTTIKEIVDAAKGADFTDVVLLQETRGEPDAMIVSHLPFGPTVSFSLSNAVLRHDIEDRGTVSEAAPHLIFHNFGTKLGTRISNILKHLFPVPKEDSKRVLTFSNDADFISFRHHTYSLTEGAKASAAAAAGSGNVGNSSIGATGLKRKDIVLSEVGPRFELHPYSVKLGTLDQRDAETEWVLRPYMNTARKRSALGEKVVEAK